MKDTREFDVILILQEKRIKNAFPSNLLSGILRTEKGKEDEGNREVLLLRVKKIKK